MYVSTSRWDRFTHAPVCITQQSSHKFTCFVMNFFQKTTEVHYACIHYHSHTYIRHRDIASLLPDILRSMPKNTPRVCTLVLSFKFEKNRYLQGSSSDLLLHVIIKCRSCDPLFQKFCQAVPCRYIDFLKRLLTKLHSKRVCS